MLTLSQAYRQAQAARPKLDYPYLSLPDIDENTIEQNNNNYD